MLPLASATQVLLLAAGLTAAANTAFDSQGKLFQVTFVRNVNGDLSQQNATSLSLRLINPQKTLATVTVYDFQYDDVRNFTPTVNTVQVQPQTVFSVNISSSMMWDYVQSGIKQVEYNKRVTVESDQDIQVYAINEQISGYNAGSGDSYMVLPNSLAGLDYVVSFPDVSQQVNGWNQFAVIHLLPTLGATTNVTVWISAVSKGGQIRQDHVTLTNGNTTSFHYYAQAGGDYPDTVYLHGDGSFQIVAGVTCAAVGTAGSKCDHIEWMPSPAINKVCSPGFLEVTYPVVPLSVDAMYSVGMPNDACTGIWNYTIYDSGSTYCKGNLTAETYQGPESTVQRCHFNNSGVVNFVADAAAFIVARFETSKDPGSGMFADNVPELTQFLLPDTETHFFALNPNDVLVYILLDGGGSTAKFNDSAVNGTAITVEKRNYIYGSVSLPAAGVYKFWSSTNYTLLVYGIIQTGFSYGYVPAVMQQRLVLTGSSTITQPTSTIPTTTTTTTTTSTTTTTTPTTTSSATTAPPSTSGQTTTSQSGQTTASTTTPATVSTTGSSTTTGPIVATSTGTPQPGQTTVSTTTTTSQPPSGSSTTAGPTASTNGETATTTTTGQPISGSPTTATTAGTPITTGPTVATSAGTSQSGQPATTTTVQTPASSQSGQPATTTTVQTPASSQSEQPTTVTTVQATTTPGPTTPTTATSSNGQNATTPSTARITSTTPRPTTKKTEDDDGGAGAVFLSLLLLLVSTLISSSSSSS